MTGFGAASRAWLEGPGARSAQLGVEIRGVNQRFLEIKLRSPFGAATEQEVRRRIEAKVGRGRIDASIFVQREEASGAAALDEARVLEVLEASRRIAALTNEAGLVAAPVNPLQVLGMVSAPARAQGVEGPMAAPEWLIECVDQAIAGLVAMREAEGAALCEVLFGLVEALEAQVSAIRAVIVDEGERLHVRLCERITALCARAGVEPLTPDRLVQEIAVVVQRSDITEELDRLGSHVGQVRGVLAGSAQVGQGKTLDFLTQELFREVTTIGSKISAHAGSALVIAAKGTIERIREQVQNVE